MEMIFLFLAMILSKVQLDQTGLPVNLLPPEEPEAVMAVWSRMYPALSPRAARAGVSYLPRTDNDVSAVALYATNRLIWKNFLESEGRQEGNENAAPAGSVPDTQMNSAEAVHSQIRRRLLVSAGTVLTPDSPPDALSPAVKELVTAYMDCADLGVAVRPPDSAQFTSPLLRSFFLLYGNGDDRLLWRRFADAAIQAPFRDAVHLLPRVPRQFLPQAFNLVDQIGSSADFREAEERAGARALISVRLRMVQP